MVIKKSRDARTQLHVWSKLLDARIALQKVVLAARDLEKESDKPPADESTVKSVTKLLTCLVTLRDTYRHKSQFCREDDEINIEQYSNINDELLDEKHEHYKEIRNGIVEKWCEKTKIGTIPKRGFVALELPTLQLITNALKDKERLIRRTQLDRTSHIDDAIHPETFNDDDFYHQLLKEVISRDENRKWIELQRLRYKTKRKAETRATKGRKIKKDLVPKLVNFMAPWRPANIKRHDVIPEQIRAELMKSLFGGSIRQTKDTVDMETD